MKCFRLSGACSFQERTETDTRGSAVLDAGDSLSWSHETSRAECDNWLRRHLAPERSLERQGRPGIWSKPCLCVLDRLAVSFLLFSYVQCLRYGSFAALLLKRIHRRALGWSSPMEERNFVSSQRRASFARGGHGTRYLLCKHAHR